MNKLSALAVALAAVFMTGCGSNPPIDSRVNEASNLITALHAARELTEEFDPEDILVVFDLDNTLLAMNTELGSDQWYNWQKSLQDRPGCVPERVPELLKAQGAAYFAGSMRPTQPDTAAIVRKLQDEEFRVIVLTSRGLDFRLATFRELRRNELDFSQHAIPVDEDTRFSSLTYFPEGSSRAVLYEDGVFMVAGQHKGKMLESLLKRLEWTWPDAVVVMDDSEHKVTDLQSTLGLLDIPYRLFRYSGEDARVAAFNGEQAAREWGQVAPALKAMEQIYGSANYVMPEPYTDPACTTQQ